MIIKLNEDINFSTNITFIQAKNIDFTQNDFSKCFNKSDFYGNAPEGLKIYIDNQTPRLYRIIRNMLLSNVKFTGPTLEVAYGNGLLYPILKNYFHDMIPYSIAELVINDSLIIDGEKIECVQFECDKTELPHVDNKFGSVIFFDTLEHLIVDPIWTILEFNRVLKKGGRILIATPNAASTSKLSKIFYGISPATENEFKPTAIYQRHNREWTIDDLYKTLECCGFGNCVFSTNDYLINENEVKMLKFARSLEFLGKPKAYYGPEIFCIAEKIEHKTIKMDLPKDERWPQFLYTSYDAYRKRPKTYPILVDINDYYQ